MKVIDSVGAMQSTCRRLARDGKSIRFVPTMGALHAGHSSLIKRAVGDNARDGSGTEDGLATPTTGPDVAKPVVVVSIFANPIQFNDSKDFANYPRTTQADLDLCKRLGAHYVFVPKCEDIYPPVPSSCDRNEQAVTTSGRCLVKAPAELSLILEGESRTGHFEGMLTVVCKLFNIIQPDRAYFGIKDYQQLVLVTRMVQDLNLPVKICPVDTVREPETNLPLSSRNIRLDLEQRRIAAKMMYDTLTSTKLCLEERCRQGNQLRSDCANGDELNMILLASLMTSQLWLDFGDNDAAELANRSRGTFPLRSAQTAVEYFELRCASDLSKIDYDPHLEVYDCLRGCVKRGLLKGTLAGGDRTCPSKLVLDARLLICIFVSKVRLLDNIGVHLNL